ncbi:hypothetical protein YC2023_107739 [Brassica napus]
MDVLKMGCCQCYWYEGNIFVLLGDPGEYLTGRQAADLLDTYLERLGSGQEMATPQCLVNSIGQTHKFKVKVTPYNFTAKRQIITATRVSVLQYPPPPNPTRLHWTCPSQLKMCLTNSLPRMMSTTQPN